MDKYLDLPAPNFSGFRTLMETWDRYCYLENSVQDLLDRNGLILFFKKGNDLYGAPEESRLVFAKLKSGDEDDPMTPGWRDEARFLALNLLKSLTGEPVQNMFGTNDLGDMRVCDREDIVQQLMNHAQHPPKKEKKKDHESAVRKKRDRPDK